MTRKCYSRITIGSLGHDSDQYLSSICNQRVYLATNARSKEELGFLRQKNVVLLNDLIDDVDRAELGFSAPFTDTLAIVEQCLIMRSAYFAGDVRWVYFI